MVVLGRNRIHQKAAQRSLLFQLKSHLPRPKVRIPYYTEYGLKVNGLTIEDTMDDSRCKFEYLICFLDNAALPEY